MILIDTNILYIWSGISTDFRLNKSNIESIHGNGPCVVGTPSICECLWHFKDDLGSMKKLLDPILKNKILVINTPQGVLERKDLEDITSASSVEDISEIVERVKNFKIEAEHEIYRFYFIVLLSSIIYSLNMREKKRGIDEEALAAHSSALIQSNMYFISQTIKHFTIRFYDGSENKEKLFKECFDVIFECVFRAWKINVYYVRHGKNISDINLMDSDTREKILGDLKSDKELETYGDNPMALVKKKSFRIDSQSVLDFIREDLLKFLPSTIPAGIINFMTTHVFRRIQSGAKFDCNDAMDTLLYSIATSNNFDFLLLDKDLARTIQECDSVKFNFLISQIPEILEKPVV